jgi:hypothetical protein
MKKIIVCVMAIILLVSSYSCASEMPSLKTDSTDTQKEDVALESIDSSRYTVSTVLPQSDYIRNFPGYVVVSNQDRGLTLYYVNKVSMEQRIFCFDPLCQHTACIAKQAYHVKNLIYHPGDGNIYGVIGDGPRMGSTLYCMNVETQEMSVAWEGNGNALSGNIYSYENYLYFGVSATEGGIDIMRYDAQSGKTVTLPAPENRTFYRLYISGSTIAVKFLDDSALYLTDEEFHKYTRANGVENFKYMKDNIVISFIQGNGLSIGLPQGYLLGFCCTDMNSGESHVFYESDVPIYAKGFDGEYIYFSVCEIEGDHYTVGDILYRVSSKNGNVEVVCHQGGNSIREIHYFEDTLYYYRKEHVDGKAMLLYGILQPTNGAFTAEDFEIIHP